MHLDLSGFASLFIAGISRGMIYFLLAAGLTLIFGTLNVVNFAHGGFYMLGVFLCYTVAKSMNLGLAFLIVPVLLALMGGVAEFFLFRRIYKAEHVMQLLLSIGLTYIISDLVRISWGVAPLSLGMPRLFAGFFNLSGVIIPKYNVFIIAVTLLISLSMFLLLYRTKTGSIVRACTIDAEMTRGVGVDVSLVFLLVFMAGIGLAGLASVMATPIVTGMLGMDAQMIIVAFAVIVVGGVGSIGGALIGALIIGVIESLGIVILPNFAEAFIYIIAMISLFIRPTGLFGKKMG